MDSIVKMFTESVALGSSLIGTGSSMIEFAVIKIFVDLSQQLKTQVPMQVQTPDIEIEATVYADDSPKTYFDPLTGKKVNHSSSWVLIG